MARRNALVLLALVAGCSTSVPPDTLATLYARHDWFALSDSIRADAPAFYRGAVACAFNDGVQCERDLAPLLTTGQAVDAHELLAYHGLRTGRYREAHRHLDAASALAPGRRDLVAGRALVAALAVADTMELLRVTPSAVPLDTAYPGLWIPVRINGHAATYFVDTGMNVPLVTEAAAAANGLRIVQPDSAAAKLYGTAGSAIPARVAIADSLSIGAMQFRHVSFLVVDDARPPFDELSVDRRGGIGLPLLIAMGSMRWGRDGRLHLGDTWMTATSAGARLAFDQGLPLVEARVEGQVARFYLDTGAEETELYPRVAQEHPRLAGGRQDSLTVAGVDGELTVPVRVLPELQLGFGGSPLALRPARLQLSRRLAPGEERQHGNLGLDVLSRAREVVIDFRLMRLWVQ